MPYLFAGCAGGMLAAVATLACGGGVPAAIGVYTASGTVMTLAGAGLAALRPEPAPAGQPA